MAFLSKCINARFRLNSKREAYSQEVISICILIFEL